MNKWLRLWRERPYWLWITLVFLTFFILYTIHLTTHWTPPREAIPLSGINFPVYWYGVIIVGGIGLGAYVVSRLALDRARALFNEQVPLAVQNLPLAALELPEEMVSLLAKQGDTLGAVLFQWGIEPRMLGLNREGMMLFYERVTAVPDVQAQWLDDPAWRVWSPELVWNGLIWVMVLGVIGARLYHVLTPSPSMAAFGIHSPADYFRNPAMLINLRNGGLGIYGGIAGGALGLALFAWRKRLPGLAWADLTTVGLALGQAIGRWGNFFNQELYGRPTNLPWAVYIDPNNRLTGFREFETFHPAFLYESLWNLLTFGLLYTLATRYADRMRTGEMTAVYLIMYAIGRTLLEMVRLDSRTITIGGLDIQLAIATVVSIAIAIVMALWMVWRRARAGQS
jgi:phosphatidylglycerol:prolipoprotein diacylglycerol transferase